MNFHKTYEKYYTAKARGDIPPNSKAKDRSIIETLETYTTIPNTADSRVLDSNTLAPRGGTKRKRSGDAAHSTAGSRRVKTTTKAIWKLIKAH